MTSLLIDAKRTCKTVNAEVGIIHLIHDQFAEPVLIHPVHSLFLDELPGTFREQPELFFL